jgi:hypothetical protein
MQIHFIAVEPEAAPIKIMQQFQMLDWRLANFITALQNRRSYASGDESSPARDARTQAPQEKSARSID